MKLLIAVTGASGLPLAVRFLESLKNLGIERHLVVSTHAEDIAHLEQKDPLNWDILCEYRYSENDLSTAICSGSYKIDGMVIIPCSMKTLAHIAHGLEDNSITRAAAVNLKEERTVILVPRESPLSLIHIENMYRAKLAGCSIVLPLLAFYFYPRTIEDIINHVVGKILDLLHIPHQLYPQWTGGIEKKTSNI